MATRDITVTVDKSEWRALKYAAECAGMSLEAYVCWGVRLLALESRPEGAARHHSAVRAPAVRRTPRVADELESVAWSETFAERLSHRAEGFRND
ncbi:hypothetical protein [Nocardia brasiliensis]|uniref:Uncharacterized protein n=1 Tax=Nocardia brasiliensis (strain ATCC 700358 / HUJEG-1) TaxID=1133849 RepID=K0F030_NOCB7|nr:hypothetical protein [Nocardia brasiliensis]AFU01026.1 hypothetical protein O3I_015325 [Nocardia brasiliensis ATCC 700358]OCF84239.1 hypothetical protein AW168_03920 [Nocardia brasiliensis]